MLSVIADELATPPERPAGAQRLARIAAPYLCYLREHHAVDDAREITQVTLTFALWTGAQLAALMHHDTQRITSYTHARTS
jgi:hypothetical protein